MKQKPGGGGGGDGEGGGGADFQDVGSQFWDLDFTQWASHDPGSTRLHSVRRSRAPTSVNIFGQCNRFVIISFEFHLSM